MAGGSSVLFTPFPSPNIWYRIVATITGATGTIYIDEAQVATGTVPAVVDSFSTLEIGLKHLDFEEIVFHKNTTRVRIYLKTDLFLT